MFGFFRKSEPRHPAAALSEALLTAGRTSSANVAGLQVLERRGNYAGRRVTYFRAFDPADLAARAVTAAAYTDLDSYPDLVLASGHLEQDGAVMLNRAYLPTTATPGPR
jgi:hypothetical protein